MNGKCNGMLGDCEMCSRLGDDCDGSDAWQNEKSYAMEVEAMEIKLEIAKEDRK